MEKYKPEPGYREPYTEYGMEIVMFCAKHCLTKKALAAEAGIPYDSLLATIKGRRSGHNVKKCGGITKVIGQRPGRSREIAKVFAAPLPGVAGAKFGRLRSRYG